VTIIRQLKVFVFKTMEIIMKTILTLSVLLIAGTITMSANANASRDDVGATAAISGTKIGIEVALNPQPLPPRCQPPGCGAGGGHGIARSNVRQRR
jgi:hypothetical protein